MSGRLRREGNRPILQILLQILGPKRADVLGQAVWKLVRAGAALNGRFACRFSCRFFGRQVEPRYARPPQHQHPSRHHKEHEQRMQQEQPIRQRAEGHAQLTTSNVPRNGNQSLPPEAMPTSWPVAKSSTTVSVKPDATER